jgi:hypothetical protein
MSVGSVIGSILPQAVGVAISPIPIIAVILMLFSRQAKRNGTAFLAGWLLALALVGAVVLELADLGKVSAGGSPSTLAYIVKLLLGVLLVVFAVRDFRSRPKGGEEPKMPKWMETIDRFAAWKAFGLGALLSGANPKNLALTVAAALSIVNANLAGALPWLVLLGFIIIASISIATPVLYYLFARESAQKTLNSWKAWLVANNATVMFLLLLVFGFALIGEGLGGVIG